VVVELVGASAAEAVVSSAGTERRVALTPGGAGTSTTADLGWVDLAGGLQVRFREVRPAADDVLGRTFAVLDRARISYDLKSTVLGAMKRLDGAALLANLGTLALPGNLWGVLAEIVSATRPTPARGEDHR
jgi:hypothetical protein